MQRASLRGGGRRAQPGWNDGERRAPRSSWKMTGLLTELPKSGNASDRLLPERRGQLLTLLQQAPNLCNPQTCSRLLMVAVLLLPLPVVQSGAQQCSRLLMVLLLLPPLADGCIAQKSSLLLLLPHARLPKRKGKLLPRALLPFCRGQLPLLLPSAKQCSTQKNSCLLLLMHGGLSGS